MLTRRDLGVSIWLDVQNGNASIFLMLSVKFFKGMLGKSMKVFKKIKQNLHMLPSFENCPDNRYQIRRRAEIPMD